MMEVNIPGGGEILNREIDAPYRPNDFWDRVPRDTFRTTSAFARKKILGMMALLDVRFEEARTIQRAINSTRERLGVIDKTIERGEAEQRRLMGHTT
jgi:hypothetical protein